jgi:hypothetical protein
MVLVTSLMILCVMSMFILCNIVIIMYMYLTILYTINDFDLIWFLKNVYFNTVVVLFSLKLLILFSHICLYLFFYSLLINGFSDFTSFKFLQLEVLSKMFWSKLYFWHMCSSLKIIVLSEDLILWYYHVLSLFILCNIVIIMYMYLTMLYAINDFDLIWFLKNVYFNTIIIIWNFLPVTWGKLNIFKDWISEWIRFKTLKHSGFFWFKSHHLIVYRYKNG